MDNLNTIRDKCKLLLAAANISGDKSRIKKLSDVDEFLKNDNCFVGADEMKVKYFLVRLGYTFDQAMEIYNSYNTYLPYEGLLEFKDDDDNLIQINTLINPEIEDYYIFDDGLIFKYDNRKHEYYYLSGGKWKYDGDLQRLITDSAYGYKRINCKNIEDNVKSTRHR